MKNQDLEKNRPIFLLIGLSAALGISFLAFEWRSYERVENDRWIFIEDIMDTLQPPQIIPIPKATTKKLPKLKPNSTIIEKVKIDLQDLELELKDKNEKTETEPPLEEADLWEDGDESEELTSLGFKLPMKNPDTRPFFESKPCLKIASNFDRYRYSIQNIQKQIQNRLYTPDQLTSHIEFEIRFKVDTLGKVMDINVLGTENPDIVKSAKHIMNQLPKMTPAYHEGEKREMETGIQVRIIY